MPRYGKIGVFNRSHYGAVLAERVLGLVSHKECVQRYDQIVAWEKMLSENHVVILKFFLHLSREEQAERFRERLEARLNPATRQRLAAASTAYRAGPFDFARDNPTEALRIALQRELAPDTAPALARLFAEHIGPEAEAAERLFLSPVQVREMLAGGMHFGGHSATHPWLDFVDDETLVREASASAAWLARLAPGPFAFAYPFGGFDGRTPAALARAGFCAAFTTRAQVRHASAFHIGRLDGEWLPPAGEGDTAFLLEARHA